MVTESLHLALAIWKNAAKFSLDKTEKNNGMKETFMQVLK